MLVLPPQVDAALSLLEAAGFEAFLVGGAVRDYVRGESEPKDWDIATDALPEQVARVFGGYRLIETGLRHGTVTVVLDHLPIEVTTYRVDGQYSDHRRPDTVSFTRSLKEDLARRDFTMNALAYRRGSGVVDFYGGVGDIEGGLVRCVGDPDRRFREDALRLLRALRFASIFGMRIEAATEAAVHRNRALLSAVAAERTQTELTKLLCGRDAPCVLRNFADVFAVPVPELAPMFGFDQRNPHHDRDIWEHTLAVVDGVPADPVMRWAALLHDVGKPQCFSVDDDGVGHFYGHAGKSEEIAGRVLSRLHFSTAVSRQILLLIRFHDLPLIAEKKLIKRLVSRLGVAPVRQLIALHRADTQGQSAACADRLETCCQAELMLEAILREDACFSRKDLAVNGDDMLAAGFRGRDVGTALESCLKAVIEERVPNERQALLAYVQGLL